MHREELKKKALNCIESRADEIIKLGELIWRNPELGFKEFKTAEITEKTYKKEAWSFENKIAITGSKAH
jgi:metal-dependent amidase/aminoacylase/carboxypeptidase family protein